jgi:hypothetical protein
LGNDIKKGGERSAGYGFRIWYVVEKKQILRKPLYCTWEFQYLLYRKALMAIHVSGQHQKHGASLADEIAKWLLQFSGNPLPPPSSSRTLFRSRRRLWPPPLQSSSLSLPLSAL